MSWPKLIGLFFVLSSFALSAAENPAPLNPCGVSVVKATGDATVAATNARNAASGKLFNNLRLGVTGFKYQPNGQANFSLSAKVFLAGRTDLLPVRWQALRLLVHQLWIEHLRRHAWWSDGRHKVDLNTRPLGKVETLIVGQGVEQVINQVFGSLNNFAQRTLALPFDQRQLKEQLNNHRLFISQHRGAREEGLQVEYRVAGALPGKVLVDGEFWPKVNANPAIYASFIAQLEKSWAEELKTGWAEDLLKEILAPQYGLNFKQMALARFTETVSLLALVQMLGRSDVAKLSAAAAREAFTQLKDALLAQPEIMLVVLANRALTDRPDAYQVALTNLTNPAQLDLPTLTLLELKERQALDKMPWPLQQLAVELTAEEEQTWQQKLTHQTQVYAGAEQNLLVAEPWMGILDSLKKRFTRAKQRRWDHQKDYGRHAAITDLGLVEKAMQIMADYQFDQALRRRFPVDVLFYQMNDLLFFSKRATPTFYSFALGDLPFYDRVVFRVPH